MRQSEEHDVGILRRVFCVALFKQRLGREIELECITDAALLGGAIIRAGDLVIDGSVRGKLQRLGSTLTH